MVMDGKRKNSPLNFVKNKGKKMMVVKQKLCIEQ